MIINTNIASMNAQRNLLSTNNAMQKSLEKLSSGFRINKAADDAAGLAISEKMRGQISGLNQANRNAQDGISMIQTAEGALNETHSILQRMRELAVQASNDTLTSSDRSNIQQELDQLHSEIDRIGNTTEFNTKKLINGGAGIATTIAGDTNGTISVLGGSSNTTTGSVLKLSSFVAASGDTQTTSGFSGTLSAASTLTINGTTFSFASGSTSQNMADAINQAGIGVTASVSGTDLKVVSDTLGSASQLTMSVSGATAFDLAAAGVTQGTNATIKASSGATALNYTASGNTFTIVQSGAGPDGMSFKIDPNKGLTDGSTITVSANNSVSLQIGANANQTMGITISDMRASALGVNALDVSSATTAGDAITTIDAAINQVSTERSKLGAYQNRLDHTSANLQAASENLSAAESRIRDVDMAKEMSQFTKNQVLSQAGVAMLAQANQAPQSVLKLLG